MNKGLVDVMAHLDDPRVQDVPGLFRRAKDAGVKHVINAGTDPMETRLLPFAPNHAPFKVHHAFGLHPMAINDIASNRQLKALGDALNRDGVVALGECGLDVRAKLLPMPRQEELLKHQILMANKRQLPLILHCVRSWGRLLVVLQKTPPQKGGVLHGYGGSPEMVPAFCELGLCFSFGGGVTREKSKKARACAVAIPLENLLVESDCPDHPPKGFDAGQSEPGGLPLVIETLASLRGQQALEIAEKTAENAHRIFALKS